MRHRIFWMIIVGVPLALITVVAGTAAAVPVARHLASALLNSPDRLPSLAENSQVHFEPGAKTMRMTFRLCCQRPSLGSRPRKADPSPIR
jgi:hypothetical protein